MVNQLKQIVLASNNKGKIQEFQELLAPYAIEIIPQAQLKVPEIDEPYSSFVENSLHKARHCSKITGLSALADDSGLCIEALNGDPGVLSARYADEQKSDQANNEKVLANLIDLTNRKAYFYCSLVFIRNYDDPQPVIAEGILHGLIAKEATGTFGHGYDPIFWLTKYAKTVAELESGLKNKISHRAQALQELVKKLKIFGLI